MHRGLILFQVEIPVKSVIHEVSGIDLVRDPELPLVEDLLEHAPAIVLFAASCRACSETLSIAVAWRIGVSVRSSNRIVFRTIASRMYGVDKNGTRADST